jgi:preprotein translocase subunit SecD
MNFYMRRFNTILQLIAVLALAAGCATGKKEDKQLAALRLHIESGGNAPDNTQDVSVLRAEPLLVTIATEPVLTEANIVAAKLLETPGGFEVEIKFDETGGWILEQNSSACVGKHFAIFGQWGEKLKDGRWLAAPLINHRIADGTLVFSPDASREEAQQMVVGLNRVAKKNAGIK